MTGPENERLGILETEVAHIKSDVSEIKSDVKSLVTTQSGLAIALAAKEAAERVIAQSRSQTGVWLRFFSERFLAIIALAVAAAAIISKG